MKRIWIDITNTPQVNFLLPVIKFLKSDYKLIISARDFSETVPLLRKNGINPIIIGDHKGKSRLLKILGFFERLVTLNRIIPDFDISVSMGGNQPALLSRVRNKKSIIFSDNDLSFKGFSYRYGTHFIFPRSFKHETVIKKFRIPKQNVHIIDGFKEDIYIADYIPDQNFLNILPFAEFITIRPENLKANYVPTDAISIVPELFHKLQDFNILYLPRYKEEVSYARNYSNVYIPEFPLSGLDVCYNTSVMLTGAGSFAREAALLGTPAVSFFPNTKLLSVDEEMVKKGMVFYSRNVDQIVDFVKNRMKSKKYNTERIIEAKKIQLEMLNFIRNVIQS